MAKYTSNELKQMASKYSKEYKIVAIRTQEQPFTIGKIDHISSHWTDGNETDHKINGICATNIRAWAKNPYNWRHNSSPLTMHGIDNNCNMGFYFGEHQAIICGNEYKYGNDAGEVIILDPVCVEVIA
jgi:hypothetical protein